MKNRVALATKKRKKKTWYDILEWIEKGEVMILLTTGVYSGLQCVISLFSDDSQLYTFSNISAAAAEARNWAAPARAGSCTGRQPSWHASTDRRSSTNHTCRLRSSSKAGQDAVQGQLSTAFNLSGSEKGHVVLPGEAWRGPRDQMVYVLIGEQAVQHHDEGVQARHLQTEWIHLLKGFGKKKRMG